MDAKEVAKRWYDRNYNLKHNPNNIVQGAGIVDTNDNNISFTPLIEIMEKQQKELIEYLKKKKRTQY